MVATNPPVQAVEVISRLTHGELTIEGRHDIEERLKGAQLGVERRELDLYHERQRLSYLTSVLLCHHEIIKPSHLDKYKCLRCKYTWFESTPT
jgi:hypothetical protein